MNKNNNRAIKSKKVITFDQEQEEDEDYDINNYFRHQIKDEKNGKIKYASKVNKSFELNYPDGETKDNTNIIDRDNFDSNYQNKQKITTKNKYNNNNILKNDLNHNEDLIIKKNPEFSIKEKENNLSKPITNPKPIPKPNSELEKTQKKITKKYTIRKQVNKEKINIDVVNNINDIITNTKRKRKSTKSVYSENYYYSNNSNNDDLFPNDNNKNNKNNINIQKKNKIPDDSIENCIICNWIYPFIMSNDEKNAHFYDDH